MHFAKGPRKCSTSNLPKSVRPRLHTRPNQKRETSMSRYKWVHHNDTKLFQVGILPDGTLYNPNGYPDIEVRAAVLAADQRRHERRSRAAKEASKTRALRQQRKVHTIAHRIAARQSTGPRHHCYVCGRGLADPQSITRGIGSECWQDVLNEIERLRRNSP